MNVQRRTLDCGVGVLQHSDQALLLLVFPVQGFTMEQAGVYLKGPADGHRQPISMVLDWFDLANIVRVVRLALKKGVLRIESHAKSRNGRRSSATT